MDEIDKDFRHMKKDILNLKEDGFDNISVVSRPPTTLEVNSVEQTNTENTKSRAKIVREMIEN